jgi:uncharacterized protein
VTTADDGQSAEGTASSPASVFDVLLDLQEADLSLDRLAYRRRNLEERKVVADLGADLAERSARVAESRVQRDKLAGQQDGLERHIETISSRIAHIDERLRSGRAGSYRDEQAMGEEAASLSRQRRELEDQELEVMEALEPLDVELDALEDGVAAAEEELGLAREQLALAEASLDAETSQVRARRAELATRLPPDLSSSYERLRQRHGGVGVARLIAGACDGCHLQLPASELDHLRHAAPGSVHHCDQCGRILVP